MYDPQGDYQNGYNYGSNGGGWRNDMNSHETSGYNAAKQQEEARRFQQIQQQEAQRRQQEDARRTQQQFFDQQAAQQRQQQAAWQQPFQSSARTSYAGSVYTGGGSASRSQTAVSSGFSSTSCAPHTPTDRKAFGWVFLLGVLGFHCVQCNERTVSVPTRAKDGHSRKRVLPGATDSGERCLYLRRFRCHEIQVDTRQRPSHALEWQDSRCDRRRK